MSWDLVRGFRSCLTPRSCLSVEEWSALICLGPVWRVCGQSVCAWHRADYFVRKTEMCLRQFGPLFNMFVILDSEHGFQAIFAFPLASSGHSHPCQCGAPVGQTCAQGLRSHRSVYVGQRLGASDGVMRPDSSQWHTVCPTSDHWPHRAHRPGLRDTGDCWQPPRDLKTPSPASKHWVSGKTQSGSREKSEIKAAVGFAGPGQLGWRANPEMRNALWKLIEGRPGLEIPFKMEFISLFKSK